MSPNEHLIEQYVRIVKKWFTITNIGYGINKDIDILALDKNRKAYHIEVDIHKGGLQWGPESPGHWSVKGYKEKKFNAESKHFIKKEFGISKTHDIWVCWGVHPKVRKRAFIKAKKYNLEIWEFKKILKELWEAIGTPHYGNDIIQSLSLLKAAREIK